MWLRCRRARRWWRRRRITDAGAETVVKHLSLALQAALPQGSKVTSLPVAARKTGQHFCVHTASCYIQPGTRHARLLGAHRRISLHTASTVQAHTSRGGGTSACARTRTRVARFGSSSAHCNELVPLRKLERDDRLAIARARRVARLIVADAATTEDDLAPRAQREHDLGAEIAHGGLTWIVHGL